MNKVRLAVGVAAILVGIVQLYLALGSRPSGESVSTLGLVTGVIFLALGAVMIVRARGVK